MRRVPFLFSVIWAVHAAGNSYPDARLKGMSGFARKGGTTGGSTGPVITVKNLEELKKYISDEKPYTIVITAEICSHKKNVIFLGSNKSLIGSYKANVLNNVYFHTERNSSNIIFQNLYFKHSQRNIDNSDIQLNIEFGEKYWIDHCTFDGTKVNIKDLGKLLSILSVNYVTVSYCHFKLHNFGLVLGFPSDNESDIAKNKGLPQLTIMFNFFENINARAPGLMRFGRFHVFNNYIYNCRLAMTIGFQSSIYSENNDFYEDIKHSAVLDDKGTGFFKDVGSVAMPKKHISQTLRDWNPSKSYHYKVYKPGYAKKFCVRYAGTQREELNFAAENLN